VQEQGNNVESPQTETEPVTNGNEDTSAAANNSETVSDEGQENGEAVNTNKTVTIKFGNTPIGLIKQVEGAEKFSADDYNTLMEMNIKANNIKDTTMSEKLQKKYGVRYMLHPDMNITVYTQKEIEYYKETGELPNSN